MASDGPELDLYADDIGDEFSQEYVDNDLYDDVLTSNSSAKRNTNQSSSGGGGGGNQNNSSNNNNNDDDDDDSQQQQQINGTGNNSSNNNNNSNSQTNNSSGNNIPSSILLGHGNQSSSSSMNEITSSNHYGSSSAISSNNSARRPSLYVGNLTWWTTDDDIIKSLNSINVNDVTEVRFFENRANGQSKGFCTVYFQSEQSVRTALEKMKQTVIHNQSPMVTLSRPMRPSAPLLSHHSSTSGSSSGGAGGHSQPRLSMPHPTLSFGNTGSSMLGAGSNQSGNHHHQSSWNNHLMSNGPRNNPLQSANANALNPMLRLNQGNHRSLSNQPLLSAPGNQSSLDLRSQLSSAGLTGVHGQMTQAALFASQSGLNLPPGANDLFSNRLTSLGVGPFGQNAAAAHSMFGDRSLDPLSSIGHHHHHHHNQMSEAEFEEILNKNKNLSNTVISQAVSDASSGDYSAAIDKLSTAISLIEGSRVSKDERCKIIISTLQDTLQGIKQKAYSSGGSRSKSDHRLMRSRSRDRDDHRTGGSSSHRGSGGSSRDRDHKDRGRGGGGGRERSRSRERDYRERSRDRYHEDHRSHYEDRYREKDRDRDHRGRH
ncbi:Cleavage and polyadenylation specificity factor subunit 6 [Dermatophagoides pteronyssinus]|uniref:Cleavage and polyadenylation specificity factor subunit 6 n=1 Tax=Dermatophagoides pteronyssinus TaxID=6956 RepID=A0ABQ8J377_DERPT|nr:Cleavage and polyadenylation specificity factor subunit 6 [Dermatophagoides pteronyssinus]